MLVLHYPLFPITKMSVYPPPLFSTDSVDHEVGHVLVCINLVLHISDELLAKVAEEGFDGELGRLNVQIGLLTQE